MILLPCSKTLAVGSAVATGTEAFGAFVCFAAAICDAAGLFTRKPRRPLRIPRLRRGLAEMMSR